MPSQFDPAVALEPRVRRWRAAAQAETEAAADAVACMILAGMPVHNAWHAVGRAAGGVMADHNAAFLAEVEKAAALIEGLAVVRRALKSAGLA